MGVVSGSRGVPESFRAKSAELHFYVKMKIVKPQNRSKTTQEHSLRKSIFSLDPEFTDLKKVPQKREAPPNRPIGQVY